MTNRLVSLTSTFSPETKSTEEVSKRICQFPVLRLGHASVAEVGQRL